MEILLLLTVMKPQQSCCCTHTSVDSVHDDVCCHAHTQLLVVYPPSPESFDFEAFLHELRTKNPDIRVSKHFL